MNNQRKYNMIVLSLSMLTIIPVFAQQGSEDENSFLNTVDAWNINGDITLQYDRYKNLGNNQISSFTFSERPQTQVFKNLNFDRAFSSFNTVRGYLNARVNQSELGGQERGLIFDRGQINWSNGEGEIPFRLLAGDYYAFLSPRTVQRSLKGLSFEMQPELNWGGDHSLVVFSGVDGQTYREVESKRNFTAGASWGVFNNAFGNITLNYVYNFQKQDTTNTQTLPQVVQHVYGLAYENTFTDIVIGQEIGLQAEISQFTGDYRQGNVLVSNQDDQSIFIDVQGRGETPLTYSMTFEDYGVDFRPEGSTVTPDQQRIEGRVGWRFKNNISLSTRYLDITDNESTNNPLHNRTIGLTASGPLRFLNINNLSFSYSGFFQDIENSNNTTDSNTISSVLSVNYQANALWGASFSVQMQDQENNINNQTSFSTLYNFNFNRRVQFGSYTGFIRPGLALNRINGLSQRIELTPTFTASLSNNIHRFVFNARYQDQRPDAAADTNRFNMGFEYNYRKDKHNLQLIAEYEDVRQDNVNDNHGYHIGLRYTMSFDKPKGYFKTLTKTQSDLSTKEKQTTAIPKIISRFSFGLLAPSQDLAQVKANLESTGFSAPSKRGCCEIYERQILDSFFERQLLALQANLSGNLERSVLVMEIGGAGDSRSIERQYNQLQEYLVSEFGAPEQVIEEGVLNDNFRQSFNNGEVIRLSQWRLADGLLRLGIPRRLDGQIRFEIQYAKILPPVTEPFWSIEEIDF